MEKLLKIIFENFFDFDLDNIFFETKEEILEYAKNHRICLHEGKVYISKERNHFVFRDYMSDNILYLSRRSNEMSYLKLDETMRDIDGFMFWVNNGCHYEFKKRSQDYSVVLNGDASMNEERFWSKDVIMAGFFFVDFVKNENSLYSVYDLVEIAKHGLDSSLFKAYLEKYTYKDEVSMVSDFCNKASIDFSRVRRTAKI